MRILAVLPLLLAVACQPDWQPTDCENLDDAMCILPYPSQHFLTEDETTATGFRVDYGEETWPENRDLEQIKPTYFNELDGFSTTGSMLFYFADGALDGMIGHENLADYTAADARTVLLNTVTGERVPHFVELDMSATNEDERLYMMRPVTPLEHGTRYVVGIRGLVTNGGTPVAVDDDFIALRDGDKTDRPNTEYRRKRFNNEVFPVLEEAGFPRDDLQLAWDFTTVSKESSLGRSVFMREDMLASMPDKGFAYTVDSTEEQDCAADGNVWFRRVKGTITVPLYMTEDKAGSFLTRDDSGMPYQNGTTTVPWFAQIPCSLAEDPRPRPAIQYGHGLLGDYSEAKTGWLAHFGNDAEMAHFAMNWTGMSTYDVPAIAVMLTQDVSDFALLPERSQQGFLEWIAMVRLMKATLYSDAALQVDGVSVIDPEQIVYYGNSQGGILGGAYVAMSPDIKRGVFGVTGGPYQMLLTRSVDFDPFFKIFKEKFVDQKKITVAMAGMQHLWDPSESAGWLHAFRDTQPEREGLLQVAQGDAQVSVLGAHFQARGIGAKLITPVARPIFGLEEVASGHTGSALVEWAYSDVDPDPVINTPPNEDTDTHECPRRSLAGQEQIQIFLETGVIENTCDGACIEVQAEVCP